MAQTPDLDLIPTDAGKPGLDFIPTDLGSVEFIQCGLLPLNLAEASASSILRPPGHGGLGAMRKDRLLISGPVTQPGLFSIPSQEWRGVGGR